LFIFPLKASPITATILFFYAVALDFAASVLYLTLANSIFMVKVALVETIHESKDGLYILLIFLQGAPHFPLHRLEFSELEYEFGQVYIMVGEPLS
jgi:hypothetical protein